MLDMDYCFSKNEQIICKELEGSSVLIDPYRRTLVRLNETGLEVWGRLDGKRSVMAIVEELKEIFEIDEKSLVRDVVGFLDDLTRREIVS